ncbi:sigma 54-interacting transcriptional regulator [Phaeovulum sp.]|uniref:sigma 54-interacting transcriptional regulator n=1 Tax=Phaeovulum sp. TaxID=2934796 RepID=UPI00356418B1
MTQELWPGHPLFGAPTPDDATDRLELLDDGILCLAPDGTILSANAEACRILDQSTDIVGQRADDLLPDVVQWRDLLSGGDGQHRRDVVFRARGGPQIMATARRRAEQSAPEVIILRDVETIRHRRERAGGGNADSNVRFLSANRTRPDFATQRRLCPDLNRMLSRGERATREGMRILITGESGVGKSEVARFLHSSVADARDPFIVVNCASYADTQFAEALFGQEKGPDGELRPGLLEQAEGGTLFLDEVGEIPLSAQARLLGFLEDGLAMRIGGLQGRLANVRVIAATNRDLRQMVREGRFRADLYFRLAVIVLTVPPLRDMPALIGHLTDRFLQTFNQRRRTPMILPARYRDLLEDYSFPGNIRELLNIVQKAAIFVDDAESIDAIFADLLAPMDIPGAAGDGALPAGAMFDLRSELRRYESALIDKAIRIHGSKRKAAKALGVNIGTIVRKTADAPDSAAPDATTNKRGTTT